MPSAIREMISTGRRPKRSLRLPKTGAHKNCIKAKTNISQPPQLAACERPSPVRAVMILGVTGMMMPRPIVSTSMVMKMKASAKRLAGGETGSLILPPDPTDRILVGAPVGVLRYFPKHTCYDAAMHTSSNIAIRLAVCEDAQFLPQI